MRQGRAGRCQVGVILGLMLAVMGGRGQANEAAQARQRAVMPEVCQVPEEGDALRVYILERLGDEMTTDVRCNR